MDYVGTILFFIENSKLYFLIPYDSNHKLHLPTKLKPVDESEVSCAFASIPSSLNISQKDIQYIGTSNLSSSNNHSKSDLFSINFTDKISCDKKIFFLAKLLPDYFQKFPNPIPHLWVFIDIENEFSRSLLSDQMLLELDAAKEIIKL